MDRSSFIVPGQGAMGQAKNLAKGRTSRDSQNSGRAGIAKKQDGTRDKMEQSRKGLSKTGKGHSKTENDVL